MSFLQPQSKIIINCISVKKRAGGVFQIAQNFIRAIYKNSEFDLYYILSEDLEEALREILIQMSPDKIFVFPTQPDFTKTYLKVKKQLKHLEKRINARLVYTIAAPCYFQFTTPEIMRYANAWFVNLNKYAFSKLSFIGKIGILTKTWGYRYLLRKCNYFITQTESSKSGILKVVKCPSENIKVIPNYLPNIYKKYPSKQYADISQKDRIEILYVAAPHPNKNINLVLPVLKKLIDDNVDKKIYFHLTLPSGKFLESFLKSAIDFGVQEHIINHGYCTQDQLAKLFLGIDIFFFPSVLETFSLSLIEAMYFHVPIVASDLDFNTDILKDGGLYFAPDDYFGAVTQINRLINEKELYINLQRKEQDILDKELSLFDYNNGIKEILIFFKCVIKREACLKN